MAADPGRRRVAIDDLSKRRTTMSWLVILMLIVVFISIWSGKGPGVLYISAAFSIPLSPSLSRTCDYSESSTAFIEIQMKSARPPEKRPA